MWEAFRNCESEIVLFILATFCLVFIVSSINSFIIRRYRSQRAFRILIFWIWLFLFSVFTARIAVTVASAAYVGSTHDFIHGGPNTSRA